MILSLLICVICMSGAVAQGISKDQRHGLTPNQGIDELKPFIERHIVMPRLQNNGPYEPNYAERRKKRGVSGGIPHIISYIAYLAWKELTAGARRISPDFMLPEKFLKKGDFKKAVKDFKTLNPSNVKEFQLQNGASVVSGRVGDRRFVVKSGVNGEKYKAEITAYQDKANVKQRNSNKIYYVDSKKFKAKTFTP